MPKTPLQRFVHTPQIPLEDGDNLDLTSLLPKVPVAQFSASHHLRNISTTSYSQQQNPAVMNKVTDGVDIATIMQKQCDLADLLVNQQRQAGLPKKEILVFSGDPLKNKSFMQSFKCNIEDKTNNNQDRLYFLEQFTSGKPKDLVQSCCHRNADDGYKEAMRHLEYHFGNEFKIISAYIEKALDWNTIQPDDGKELQSYALLGCCNAVQDISSISELDLPSNLKVIVSKLPYKLRESWRSSAYDIWERTKQRPRFQDLVMFIERHARILQDPVFGDIRYTASNIKIRQPRLGQTVQIQQ